MTGSNVEIHFGFEASNGNLRQSRSIPDCSLTAFRKRFFAQNFGSPVSCQCCHRAGHFIVQYRIWKEKNEIQNQEFEDYSGCESPNVGLVNTVQEDMASSQVQDKYLPFF